MNFFSVRATHNCLTDWKIPRHGICKTCDYTRQRTNSNWWEWKHTVSSTESPAYTSAVVRFGNRAERSRTHSMMAYISFLQTNGKHAQDPHHWCDEKRDKLLISIEMILLKRDIQEIIEFNKYKLRMKRLGRLGRLGRLHLRLKDFFKHT